MDREDPPPFQRLRSLEGPGAETLSGRLKFSGGVGLKIEGTYLDPQRM